jgi:hypothetical protein
MHTESHPLRGKTVRIDTDSNLCDVFTGEPLAGKEYRLEDWWDHLTGGSWMFANGNPAALNYAVRLAMTEIPPDDEVVYGKIGAFGHLVHTSELGEVVEVVDKEEGVETVDPS